MFEFFLSEHPFRTLFRFQLFSKLSVASYIQSPLHQTMEMLSQRLTSMDEYSAMIYAALVEQWTQFYATNPHEIANHFQRNQQEQENIMNQVAFDIQRQIPLSEQHII